MKEMIKELIREEMMKNTAARTYYFMSGLPRAGSTLLSAILNQNPRIHSGPSSPVVPTMLTLENALANDELFMAYPKIPQASRLIASVLDIYYSDIDRPVIVDKNRSWVNRLHYIPGYFGIEPKVLCPVRDIDEILASFIAMHRRSPISKAGKINFMDDMLVKSNMLLTDENRCEFLSSPNGILGQSYHGLRKVLMEGKQKNIHLIEYRDLLNDPETVMRNIYEFLGEEYYKHDFTNIINQYRENDSEVYGVEDMHEVRSELKRRDIDPVEILPQSILEKCRNTEFWREINKEAPESFEDSGDNSDNEVIFQSNNDDSDTKIIGA